MLEQRQKKIQEQHLVEVKRRNITNIKELDLLEKWTNHNFIFNKQLVYYKNETSLQLSNIHSSIRPDNFNKLRKKARYQNPLQHLLSVVLEVGKKIEEHEAMERIDILTQQFTQGKDS